jgi:hypothetical protein
MARETKTQRQAREQAVRHAVSRLAVAKSTYTERMMEVLDRATKMNFELEVKEALFVLEDRDDRCAGTFTVNPVWSESADEDLYSLEQEVSWKEEAVAERERVANLRKTALAKLTAEEREALSL